MPVLYRTWSIFVNPDVHPHECEDSPICRASRLLPSEEDDTVLRHDIATMAARILTQNMPFFKLTFEDIVEWHIPHKYSTEMSSKSVVVRLLLVTILYVTAIRVCIL